ncbi:hypothetical protein BTJ49_15095 [Oleiagrimonas sp. MCCC 1A03011]|nr:hypothetical protein BTJ49_15095 [Oleiagrimonas sp. MCCC 1A03011]
MVGMAVLSVKALVCQGLADIALPIPGSGVHKVIDSEEEADESPPPRLTSLSLNLLSVAESGERKTAVYRVVAAAIYAHDEARARAYESAIKEYEADLSVWQSIERGLRRKLVKLSQDGEPCDEVAAALKEHNLKKPERPRLRRSIRQDITSRALTEVLHGDGESIALMSDEGDILLHGQSMKSLALLNAAWDGSSLPVDRADGKSFIARNPRVTTSLQVQPEVFRAYRKQNEGKARGIGYFARFLMGWPVSTQGTRFITGYEGEWKYLPQFHARVKELLEEYDRRLEAGVPKRDVICFSVEAKAHWVQLVNDTESMMQEGGAFSDVKDAAAKGCEMIARIAGILHYFSAQTGDLTLDTLERAASIMSWHIEEFRYLMRPEYEVPQAVEDAEKLRKYLYRKRKEWIQHNANRSLGQKSIDPNSMRSFEAHNRGPTQLRKKGRFRPALDVLVEQGIVYLDHVREYGKPHAKGREYICFTGRLNCPLQLGR